MQRWDAAILAVLDTASSLATLGAGAIWWASVLGLPATGPFNLSFWQEVGAALMVADFGPIS